MRPPPSLVESESGLLCHLTADLAVKIGMGPQKQ